MAQSKHKPKDEKLIPPESTPLVLPVTPKDESIPIPPGEEPVPEPIEAPGDPRGQEPIDETPDQPKIYA